MSPVHGWYLISFIGWSNWSLVCLCFVFYLAESSIVQYSYTIKFFWLELLHPGKQLISDEWSSLAVNIPHCFSYEHCESKREFEVDVQWPAAHSARGRDSKTLKLNEWIIPDRPYEFANKTKRRLWILFSKLVACSGMRHCCYYSTSSSASKNQKQNRIWFWRATKAISLLESDPDFALSLNASDDQPEPYQIVREKEEVQWQKQETK